MPADRVEQNHIVSCNKSYSFDLDFTRSVYGLNSKLEMRVFFSLGWVGSSDSITYDVLTWFDAANTLWPFTKYTKLKKL